MEKSITSYAALVVEKACIDAYLEIINHTLNKLHIPENEEHRNSTLEYKKNCENSIKPGDDSIELMMSDSFEAANGDSTKSPGKDEVTNTIESGGQRASQVPQLPLKTQINIGEKVNGLHFEYQENNKNEKPDKSLSSSVLEGNEEQPRNRLISRITHSTPVKKQVKGYQLDLSHIELKTGKYKAEFEKTLSSNLGLIVGDISGNTDTTIFDGDYNQSDIFREGPEQRSEVNNVSSDDWSQLSSKLSTLDMADLDSVDPESELESQGKTKDLVKALEIRHSKEIEGLQVFYETEIRKLRQEKDSLLRSHQIPSHATSLINMKYLEEIKSELESRCQQYELRNRQLTLKVDGLSRSCFESERRCRVLETDKSILQERCYKADQEKRKTAEDLSKVQELLNESLSSRRRVEDELIKLKRKEINSESRLNDSDHALKEICEDLNSSRHDNAEKTEMIQKITSQRDEIQDNLNEALRQITRLEEASSQRTTEKNLFQQLLEEYELLYNQHQRIRSLYNKTLKRQDGDLAATETMYSPKMGRNHGLKIERGNSSRKKWSMSPSSPSIREQDPFIAEKDNFTSENTKRKGTTEVEKGIEMKSLRQTGWKRDNRSGFNRNSTGSILSWGTSTDKNNNISENKYYNRGRNEREDNLHVQKDTWKSRSFPEDPSQVMDSSDRTEQSYMNDKDDRKWIVHNLNGITRFDVVFSSPNQSGNSRHDSESEKKQFRRSQGKESSPFSHMQTSENGVHEKSAEITNLESDLVKLSGEKNEIESQLSRLPLTGSGRSRRMNVEKQELLEERLEEVTRCIGNIKMTLKQHKAM